jgi:hypothetical protein
MHQEFVCFPNDERWEGRVWVWLGTDGCVIIVDHVAIFEGSPIGPLPTHMSALQLPLVQTPARAYQSRRGHSRANLLQERIFPKPGRGVQVGVLLEGHLLCDSLREGGKARGTGRRPDCATELDQGTRLYRRGQWAEVLPSQGDPGR